MTYTPDRWCLVRLTDDLVKVMGCWSGGYLDGDSWRFNSGIEKVESTDDAYLFHGYSNSVYECRKTAYGITAYGSAVMSNLGLDPMNEEEAKEWISRQ